MLDKLPEEVQLYVHECTSASELLTSAGFVDLLGHTDQFFGETAERDQSQLRRRYASGAF